LMQHINFGMVKGMKTRKGEVVFLEDILDEARDVMHGVMQSNPEKYAEVENPLVVSDVLAVSAIVVQDMAAKRIKDYDFKLERVTQFEGDTGPYLQYAHSRLCSIERKSGIKTDNYDISLLTEKEATELAWHIARFPDTIQEARISHEPCNIVSYLMALSQCVSQCLQKLWVMGQAEEVAKARLALYKAARITLGNGLRLIGLKPLERM
jgi:arginyl-tRNA synthetase